LRRVEAVREDIGSILVFLTNHHHLSASTIAAIYKDRWQIRLFFKTLKQNLKIKTFVGTSSNAVKTLMDRTDLDALVALLATVLMFRLELRMNLFTIMV
jgi:IS4 transposase